MPVSFGPGVQWFCFLPRWKSLAIESIISSMTEEGEVAIAYNNALTPEEFGGSGLGDPFGGCDNNAPTMILLIDPAHER
jgi:hypothetical protein